MGRAKHIGGKRLACIDCGIYFITTGNHQFRCAKCGIEADKRSRAQAEERQKHKRRMARMPFYERQRHIAELKRAVTGHLDADAAATLLLEFDRLSRRLEDLERGLRYSIASLKHGGGIQHEIARLELLLRVDP